MKVVVASENPVKINAVKKGFKVYFNDVEVQGINVGSGVSSQPLTDKETLLGAHNRANEARKMIYEADYWVGIEGGIQSGEKGLGAFAWIVVYSAGKKGEARTATFLLPERLAHLIAGGLELGTASDLVFRQSNSKQKNGTVGLLTQNKIDRVELYKQGVILALIPFINSRLY